jgi:hypothetical protein
LPRDASIYFAFGLPASIGWNLMDDATESRSPSTAVVFLAGLQAGMIGVSGMLTWLGVSALWQHRSFWTSENLVASVFYGDAAIRTGFAFSTVSGLAVFPIVYCLLGAVFASAVRNRLHGWRNLLAAILFAVSWYYVWFQNIGKAAMPLVTLLHSERSTLFGHVIFGLLLARYHRYLPGEDHLAGEHHLVSSNPVTPTAPTADPADRPAADG